MSGQEAVITAFDWVGGKRRKFTRLKLRRDKNILTVKPIDGIVDLFPQEARIARYPDNDPQIVSMVIQISILKLAPPMLKTSVKIDERN
ncbi:hypothetical protein SAMN05216315_10749 [Nitrosospira sp. Nsp18]|nr:hypothetical protein SAMN05216315_10749 [Nitrosospira sp. Nsp18]